METMAAQDENNEISVLHREMVDRLKSLDLIRTEPVEQAFRTIPRHLFVPKAELKQAYTDTPIVTHERDGRPISSSSAPSVMAIMLEMLRLQPGQRILEIGAGTGYNAALMAHIVGESGKIVTIDIDEDIVQEVREHLQTAGIANVEVVCADGGFGWSEGPPYDRVILTTSAADITSAWREQLRPGGYLVLPFQLTVFDTSTLEASMALPDQYILAFAWNGSFLESVDMCPCGFMPLRGNFAQELQKMSISESSANFAALVSGSLNAHEVMQLLQIPPQDEPTEVYLFFEESYGLRLWLALREAHFCEIAVKEGVNTGLLPAQVYRDRTFHSAVGLCTESTACFILLQEGSEVQSANRRRPFQLKIRSFGPDHALVERLHRELTLWDQAGHPFVWDIYKTMKNLQVRAYATELPCTPQTLDTVLARPHTRFIFSPQIH